MSTVFKENYDEILTAHFTYKVPEKGFKINWLMRCRERLAGTHYTCMSTISFYSIKYVNLIQRFANTRGLKNIFLATSLCLKNRKRVL